MATGISSRLDLDEIDQCVVLEEVDWKGYSMLLGLRRERNSPRIVYLDGSVFFMSPSLPHEHLKQRVDRLVKVDPGLADIALIVEVCDSSYDKDRGGKWVGYAQAGVPIYWIVNLPARRVEVHTAPIVDETPARYRNQAFYDGSAEVPVTIDGRVAVRELRA